MKAVVEALCAPENQDRTFVERLAADGSGPETFTYARMRAWSDEARRALRALGLPAGTSVGLVAGNGPEWVAADLALLREGLVEVPVPLAFSGEQAASLLRNVSVCLADEAGARKLVDWGLDGSATVVHIARHRGEDVDDLVDLVDLVDFDDFDDLEEAGTDDGEDRIVKIIHTSGTTGAPKGVKIRSHGLGALLASLDSVCPPGIFDRYLSLVPFSLLIEQVTAVYLPLVRGGRMVLLPDSVSLLGTAGSRADDALAWLRAGEPTAAVLPPAVVSALDKAVRGSGADADLVFGPGRRPFLMAGGAPVDADALVRLDGAGLRVHEGYGLSENSSVVSWNTTDHWRPGTVGRPLPHCEVRVSEGGELLVRSTSLFAGYTVEDPTSRPVDEDGWLHTGDRAEIDPDGAIRILGRLKNVIITGHGRNVSPEWVEGRLRTCPTVVDAVLFGEGMEYLTAVLVTSGAEAAADGEAVRQARAYAAEHLAETDRPERFLAIPDDKAMRERYFTVTGRPRRDLIFDEIVRREPAATR
ncbi:AMP-binding protein [Streptomyces sp. NPDC048623]|uniref:AMP-binding protein n=1 Tax=Streptomyces sp. NPDC048623 TaxID=3155761 RepID=UPI00341545A7